MAKYRRLLPLLVIVLLVVIAFALFQTGTWPFRGSEAEEGSIGSTTPIPAGAQASSATAAPLAATEEATAYLSALDAWRATYWDNIDAAAFNFKKPTDPTAEEIERAQAVADQQTESVAALKLIVSPREIAGIHATYVGALEAEANAVQRMMKAIKGKNWRDMELAMRDLTQAHGQEKDSLDEIGDYMARVLPAATWQTQETGYATFSNANLGFSLQYPKSWKEYPLEQYGFEGPAPGEAGILIANPEGGSFGGLPTNIIFLGALPYDPTRNGSPRTELENGLAKLGTDKGAPPSIVRPIRDFELDGMGAAEVTISASVQGHTLLVRVVAAHSDRVMFLFGCWSEASLWEAQDLIFEQVLQSLKVSAST